MKKVITTIVCFVLVFAFAGSALAQTTTRSVYAYSTTSSNVWSSISCSRENYKVVGTAFGGPATKLTVRPKSTSGTNAAYASTFSSSTLTNGNGKPYFPGYGPGSTVNLWGNSDVPSYPASLNATWYF